MSGPDAFQSLSLTSKSGLVKEFRPRYAYYRTLHDVFNRDEDGKAKSTIDEGLMLCFKKPNSFTGENMVEFQIHGGMAVKGHLLKTLSKFDSFREA